MSVGGRTVVVWSPQILRGYRTESDALVTFDLRLACDDRTMPIFAFSCGLHRMPLRRPYDSTTSYDLRSLYDFVIVRNITNFKNRKTVDTSYVIIWAPHGDPAMIVRLPHDFCMIVLGQKSYSDRRESARGHA